MRIVDSTSNTLYYTLKDHLGSASVVTNASGNIVGENRYNPYGETRWTTGSIPTDKLYTGQREMAGLGIYHYGARFYSPKLGRFLSADTIVPGAGNPQAYNRYSYVLNNPIRYNDPTGHVCSDPDDPTPSCDGSGGTPPNTPAPLPDAPVVITNPGPLDDGQEQDDPTPTPTPDVPGQCDEPHCLDERENTPFSPWFTIGFKSWEDIDKVDLAVDIFGIIGDLALAIPGYGPIIWFVSTVPELLTVSKAWDDLETDNGSSSGILIDVGVTILESTKLIPAAGFYGNLVSIGTNVLEINP